MNVPAKIASVENELEDLKAQLTFTSSEAERVAIRQQIATTNEVLVEYMKLVAGENFLFAYLFLFYVAMSFRVTHP